MWEDDDRLNQMDVLHRSHYGLLPSKHGRGMLRYSDANLSDVRLCICGSLPGSIPLLGLTHRSVPVCPVYNPILYHRYPVFTTSAAKKPLIKGRYKITHRSNPTVTPVHSPVSLRSSPKPVPNDIGSATR